MLDDEMAYVAWVIEVLPAEQLAVVSIGDEKLRAAYRGPLNPEVGRRVLVFSTNGTLVIVGGLH